MRVPLAYGTAGGFAVSVLLVTRDLQVRLEGGRAYLACADTQPDDLVETSVALRDLLQALGSSGCRRLLLFLDPRPGPDGSGPFAYCLELNGPATCNGTSVPAPASLLLLGLGASLAGLAGRGRLARLVR